MAAIRLALVLWEFMLVMISTYDQTKSPSGFRSGRRGASERKVQSRSTPSEARPRSLWSCGPAPSSAGTPRVCHRHADCTRGITTLFSTSKFILVLTFKPTSKLWGGMMWLSLETTPKTITVAGNLVFITLGTFLLCVAIQICILRVLAMVLLS